MKNKAQGCHFLKHLTKSFDSYEEMDNKFIPNMLEIPKTWNHGGRIQFNSQVLKLTQ